MDNRTANKISSRWKCTSLKINYAAENGWTIMGRCVANDWPALGWRVGQFYILAQGKTLEEAAKVALARVLA